MCAWVSHCGGLSCYRAQSIGCEGFSSCGMWLSGFGSHVVECRLNSCGTQAQLLCGMWDSPGPGIEPMSPVLADRFFTTEPPGKPSKCLSIVECELTDTGDTLHGQLVKPFGYPEKTFRL